MQGILVGVVATLAVLLALRLAFFAVWRRRWRRGWHGRRHGRGWLLARVFRRLDASPEQEKVLLEGLDRLRDELRALREGVFASREDLAAALDAERLDPGALDAIWAKQLERAAAAKEAFTSALGRFHAALDARQRALLAEMVRAGGARRACC